MVGDSCSWSSRVGVGPCGSRLPDLPDGRSGIGLIAVAHDDINVDDSTSRVLLTLSSIASIASIDSRSPSPRASFAVGRFRLRRHIDCLRALATWRCRPRCGADVVQKLVPS
jgi:hypothetical protein